ncbi:hypothetical protein D9M68_632190 [compost metagenome]|uniref:SCP2 domain-containing protein n=1 Tax=Achromobacter agilis TaxID=1353888 RepID=A0A446C5M8_9BURK|nr:hypothetical protein [Achromobacter agilis]SSW63189.1 hypothetical protein AGI3411_01041 [Achromobacter agilis]
MEVQSIPTDESLGAQLVRRFCRLAPSFSRPRAVQLDMLVGFGVHRVLVRVRDGRVDSAETPFGPLPSCDFSLRASADAWSRFWQPVPAAGWHDLFALSKRRELAIDGNLQPLMAHLQFIKDLLAVGRETQA